MASGISSTFRQVGIAMGIAGLGAVFQSRVTSSLVAALGGSPAASGADEIGRAVTSGGAPQALAAAPPTARPRLEHAIDVAFTSALNDLLLISAIVALVGGLLALALVRSSDFVVIGVPAPQPDVP
jgi:hypothetical protein